MKQTQKKSKQTLKSKNSGQKPPNSVPNHQNLQPQQQASPKKQKQYHQKHHYICFCGQVYKSYPSLFLHCQKIHDQNIKKNNLHQKKIKWSGSVRNVYFQYNEDEDRENKREHKLAAGSQGHKSRSVSGSVGGSGGDSNGEVKYRQAEGRNCLSNSSKNLTRKQKMGCKEQEMMMIVTEANYLQQKLTKLLSQYNNTKSLKNQANMENSRNNTILDFFKYIINNYQSISKSYQASMPPTQQPNTLDLLPNAMNSYMASQVPISQVQYHETVQQLANFSLWMYCRGYCGCLAVGVGDYERVLGGGEREGEGGGGQGEGEKQQLRWGKEGNQGGVKLELKEEELEQVAQKWKFKSFQRRYTTGDIIAEKAQQESQRIKSW